MRWYANPETAMLPPSRVEADSRAWRADADRILGFWEDKIIGDLERCILATEMLEAFNAWLKENGHNEWSKETFGPRFEQHAETVKHRVIKTQTRDLNGLDRYGSPFGKDVPARAMVYKGVRFQCEFDKGKYDRDEAGGNSGNTL